MTEISLNLGARQYLIESVQRRHQQKWLPDWFKTNRIAGTVASRAAAKNSGIAGDLSRGI